VGTRGFNGKPGEATVDEVPILSGSSEDRLFKQFVARYDVPAYVRRARRVQDAFNDLVARCRHERDKRLEIVRMHARAVFALVNEEARPQLLTLGSALGVPIPPASPGRLSPYKLRRATAELTESIERFNRSWLHFLHAADLSTVNQLREDYNRYYLLEKECALRSPRLARQGFQRMKPLSPDDLLILLPLLPVPAWTG
jgi:hypothetical protein